MLGGLVYLSLIRNPGAAFSMATGMTWLLALVAIGVVIVIIRMAPRLRSTPWAVSLGLVLGGAIGNLIDRIFRSPGIPAGPRRRLRLGVRAERRVLPGVQRGRFGDHHRRHQPGDHRAAGHRLRRHQHPEARSQDARPMTAERMPDVRRLPVPGGLTGMRVDAGLAKLLGHEPDHRRDHDRRRGRAGGRASAVPRSAKLVEDSWLEITLPEPDRPSVVVAADRRRPDDPVPGRRHRGGRQAGRGGRAPEPGLDRADRARRAGRAGHLGPARPGADERQGIVHRLDVGTTGVMVVALSPSAPTRCSRTRSATAPSRRSTTPWCRATRTRARAPSTRRSAGTRRRTGSSPWWPAAGTASRTTRRIEAFPAASLLQVHLETGRTHQIRVHFAAIRHPCVGDRTYGADPTLAARLGLTRQWLHARSLAFAHPADGRWVEFTSPYPADLAHALSVLSAG